MDSLEKYRRIGGFLLAFLIVNALQILSSAGPLLDSLSATTVGSSLFYLTLLDCLPVIAIASCIVLLLQRNNLFKYVYYVYTAYLIIISIISIFRFGSLAYLIYCIAPIGWSLYFYFSKRVSIYLNAKNHL